MSLADAAPATDTPAATGAEAPADAAPVEQVDMKDVVNTDFMKGLVDDLGLDLG